MKARASWRRVINTSTSSPASRNNMTVAAARAGFTPETPVGSFGSALDDIDRKPSA
jgi:hypothetical protein